MTLRCDFTSARISASLSGSAVEEVDASSCSTWSRSACTSLIHWATRTASVPTSSAVLYLASRLSVGDLAAGGFGPGDAPLWNGKEWIDFPSDFWAEPTSSYERDLQYWAAEDFLYDQDTVCRILNGWVH